MNSIRFVRHLLEFLYVQRVKGFDPPSAPHFDSEAAARFERTLKEAGFYLEFGSGGSTIMADRLGLEGISVEADRYYAKVVQKQLKPGSKMRLIHMPIGITLKWAVPLFQRPTKARLRNWSRYVSEPFDQMRTAGKFPDFVLVDGRFRAACLLETARQAHQADRAVTVMCDDYYRSGREHYHRVEDWLGKPERAGLAAFFSLSADLNNVPSTRDVETANADFR